MVGMVLDAIVHKSNILVSEGGGGKDKKVSVIGVLAIRLETIVDKDGMDTVSMVELIVRRMCYGVADSLGSYYVN